MDRFKILSVAEIEKQKQLVISKNEKDEIVIATRATVPDGEKLNYYYDKGTIRIPVEYVQKFKKFLKEVEKNL